MEAASRILIIFQMIFYLNKLLNLTYILTKKCQTQQIPISNLMFNHAVK